MPSIPLTTASHLESFPIPKEKKQEQIISDTNSLLCNIRVVVEASSFPILNHRGLQVLQRTQTTHLKSIELTGISDTQLPHPQVHYKTGTIYM